MIENMNDLNQQVNQIQSSPNPAPKKQFQPGQQSQRNLWEDNNIKALSLSILEKKIGNKAFSVFYNTRTDIPEEVQTRLINAVKFLGTVGYNFRAWYAGDDVLGTKLTTEFTGTGSQNITWYIPWKKYNEKIPNPTSLVRTELAFQLVRGLHKGYDKLPPVVRAICARDMEVFLTRDGKHPLTFILIYTPCGSEELPENPDYKVLGQMSFVLRLAKTLGIQVFNLQKQDVGARLKEFLDGKTKAEKPIEKPSMEETVMGEEKKEETIQVDVQEPDPVNTTTSSDNQQEQDPINDLLG